MWTRIATGITSANLHQAGQNLHGLVLSDFTFVTQQSTAQSALELPQSSRWTNGVLHKHSNGADFLLLLHIDYLVAFPNSKCRGSVGNTPDSYVRGSEFDLRLRARLFWGSSWFSSIPPSKYRGSTLNRPQPLPSTSILLHSQLSSPSDAIVNYVVTPLTYAVLKTSLNKPDDCYNFQRIVIRTTLKFSHQDLQKSGWMWNYSTNFLLPRIHCNQDTHMRPMFTFFDSLEYNGNAPTYLTVGVRPTLTPFTIPDAFYN
jgi:hypothetical protein